MTGEHPRHVRGVRADAAQAAGGKLVRGRGRPRPKDAKPVDNHLGYASLAETLADKGYIVVSVAANGIQAQEKDMGHVARAALLDKHLHMWEQLSAGEAPCGSSSSSPAMWIWTGSAR
ncbi:hypothetical protein [Nonomuraea sp. NPDC049684]|uniref:hypothetical protein n=1 Tax=Nonomuraea sp. NPDC049684 TaxID=3364356 RepID=UPI0037A6A4BE